MALVGDCGLFLSWFGCGMTQFVWHSQSRPDPSMRIMFWNTCRGTLGWRRVAGVINDEQADVVGLVEAGPWSEERRAFWRESCPGYHVSLLGGGFVCLTKEPPGMGHAVHLPQEGEYRQLDVTTNGQTVTLLIVDLQSSPIRPPRGHTGRSCQEHTRVVRSSRCLDG